MYQISAAVQPGNSGGPLADKHGNIVAIVTARIDADKLYKLHGIIPQNVNYAVKLSYVVTLIKKYPEISGKIKYSSEGSKEQTLEEAVKKVRQSIVLIIAE
jgi:S1-C subfamily serine protease